MQYTHILEKSNQENFPVASLLLSRRRRKDLLAFYAFARGADGIADDPVLSVRDKQERLEALRKAVKYGAREDLPGWALPYERLLRARRLSARHGEELLSAFLQDTRQQRYRDLDELMHYCRRSAVPAGRALLELCGEARADLAAADALCCALQILNHIQDCGKDCLVLDRIYLPQDWLRQAGVTERALMASSCSPSLRGVLDRLLDRCDALLERSRGLFPSLYRRRTRMEARAVWLMARSLSGRLRREDPLARRVELSRRERLGAFWLALREEWGAL